jgi:hypothetical protein
VKPETDEANLHERNHRRALQGKQKGEGKKRRQNSNYPTAIKRAALENFKVIPDIINSKAQRAQDEERTCSLFVCFSSRLSPLFFPQIKSNLFGFYLFFLVDK